MSKAKLIEPNLPRTGWYQSGVRYRAPYGANKFIIVQRIEVQCSAKVHYTVWIEQCGLAVVEVTECGLTIVDDTVYRAVQYSSVGSAIWHSVDQCGPVHCSVVQCGPVSTGQYGPVWTDHSGRD